MLLRDLLTKRMPLTPLASAKVDQGFHFEASGFHKRGDLTALTFNLSCDRKSCAVDPRELMLPSAEPLLSWADHWELKEDERAQMIVIIRSEIRAEDLFGELKLGEDSK